MFFTEPAVNTVAVIPATVENRANHLINVLKPKNPPRLFVTAKTLMREMPALIAVAPAAANIIAHFYSPFAVRCAEDVAPYSYMLTFIYLFILYIVTKKNALVNDSAKKYCVFIKNMIL